MDVIGLGVGIGGTIIAGGVLIYELISNSTSSGTAAPKNPPVVDYPGKNAKVIPFPCPAPTPPPDPKITPVPVPVPVPNPTPKKEDEKKNDTVYIWGNETPSNFTPRAVDNSGISLYENPKLNSKNQKTTLRQLRSQGWVVTYTHTHPIFGAHYHLTPPDISLMSDWQASRKQYETNPSTNVWTNENVHALTHKLRAAFELVYY